MVSSNAVLHFCYFWSNEEFLFRHKKVYVYDINWRYVTNSFCTKSFVSEIFLYSLYSTISMVVLHWICYKRFCVNS